MLKYNDQLRLSEFDKLYDIIIPKDNLLRKIKENISFDFVNKVLEKSYCKTFGRPAKEPELMFKILFLKRMYDLSDQEVVDRALVDMSFKYFLNLLPEDKMINSSSLTKFRKLRINNENILEEILSQIIIQAIEKGVITSNSIIVDSTHTSSKGKNETPTQILRRLTKELRKEIYQNIPSLSDEFPEKPQLTSTLSDEIEYTKELLKCLESIKDEKLKKKISRIKKLLSDERLKSMQSLSDNEAKKGYKSSENNFFGYKNHLAITDERIITAIEVTDGSVGDGKQLPSLIEKSKKNGIDVKEVVGDTAYSGKDNLDYSNDIQIVSKLHPIISNGARKENHNFRYDKDADHVICKAGQLSVRKARTGKKNSNSNQVMTYYFDIEKCKTCPLKDECLKPGAKSKTYSISIKSETHKNQNEFQETDYFKKRYKERYKIEAKNAELKYVHGLDRADYYGIIGMKIQMYFSAFACNIKRIIKLSFLKMA